jgi:hypothetical protein
MGVVVVFSLIRPRVQSGADTVHTRMPVERGSTKFITGNDFHLHRLMRAQQHAPNFRSLPQSAPFIC